MLLRVVCSVALIFILSACKEKGSSGDSASTGQAPAQEEKIKLSQAHMYVIPPGQNRSAIYMRMENLLDKTLTLLHVETDIAGTTEVHHTVHEDGMMKMREVQHLKINAGETLDFEPGGLHLMLFDVAESPSAGDTVQLRLEFDGYKLTVPVEVKAIN